MKTEFEKYLKNSDHLSCAINAHHALTASVIAPTKLEVEEEGGLICQTELKLWKAASSPNKRILYIPEL